MSILTSHTGVRSPSRLSYQITDAGICALAGFVALQTLPYLFKNRQRRLKPIPKPQPHHRVSIYDLDTGQILLLDRPYVREERFDNDRYYYAFRDGTEITLNLSGMNYRIVRRSI